MTQKTSMDSLTFGLNITDESRAIGEKVIDSNDQTFIQMGLERIAQNLSNYDDFVFAGRLLIHESVRAVPSVETYLALNHDILEPKIIGFMEAHIEQLESLLKECEFDNYNNQDYFSADTLRRSYLLRAVPAKDPTETPILKNLRVAVQLYYDESIEDVVRAFKEMNAAYYTHASPTIFNAGTKNGQMASCFLMNVYDSLDSMMYTGIGDMAMISRYNGGIGIGLNRIRHSDIAGTGSSAGILPYARVCDKAIGYVDQSRKRRGAATGFLNIWHIDVEDFIRAASNYIPQDLRLVDLHTCIWMHDLFFERAKNNEDWTLFCPNTVKDLQGKYGEDFEKIYHAMEALAPVHEQRYLDTDRKYNEIRNEISKTNDPTDELKTRFIKITKEFNLYRKERIVYKKVNARDLLQLIADTQLKSGKPYVMNGDRANAKSNQQNIGPINNSNLCVEIVQYSDPNTFSSCNLASINLSSFRLGSFDHRLDDKSDDVIMEELSKCYDFEKLGQITRSVTKNLNKVIDHNFYPFDETKIKDFNLKTRPLGIGISGLDDAFKVTDIVYGSKASILLNKMIFACMYYNALTQSNELAKIHGEYHHFRTGTCKIFNHLSKDFEEYKGSPLSNGFFQFDLWASEAAYDDHHGRINKTHYDMEDNLPVDPSYFGGVDSWDVLRKRIMDTGVRNSLLLALMPTASTAQILRNAESAEAHQSNIYSRQVGNGSYNIVNRHLHKDLESAKINTPEVNDFIYNTGGSLKGLHDFLINSKTEYSEEVLDRSKFLEQKYQTMFEIKPSLFLKMARQRGIYVDQSQSTNIYIVDPTLPQLMAIQMVAYHNKLKTHIYYLRNTIPTLITGFNKKIEVTKSDGPSSPDSDESIPVCRLDNPDCLSCGS